MSNNFPDKHWYLVGWQSFIRCRVEWHGIWKRADETTFITKNDILKKVFFVSALLLGTYMVKAQSVSFGVKGGLNLSSIKASNSSIDFDPRISFHAGGWAHIHLTKEFAIQPELVFSGQGYKVAGEVFKLNYLNVPVLVQYMFDNGFRLQTGPQVGFLLSGKRNIGGVAVDIKDSYKPVSFDWAVGAGYLIPKSGVGIDARFNFGIAKINDFSSSDYRSGVFQVGVFYLLNKHWK